eukprot:873504-Amphidinium_carterae.1
MALWGESWALLHVVVRRAPLKTTTSSSISHSSSGARALSAFKFSVLLHHSMLPKRKANYLVVAMRLEQNGRIWHAGYFAL